MSKKKTWDPPGWPWELDVLALVFVIIALGLPYLINSEALANAAVTHPGGSDNPVTDVLREQRNVLWAIGIVVLYVMHLAVAGASLETISTPFVHLVTPVAFAGLAYYRVYNVAHESAKASMVSGSPLQIITLLLAVIAVTLLVARIRMARYLLRFKDVKWDVVTKARYDRTYFELIAEFRPLIYPPRAYRACDEGLLVEGWSYIMPVPFEMMQSITAVNAMGVASSGKYHASSTTSLIRMELLDNSQPLFISPENRTELLQYCAHHVARLRPAANTPKTRAGTSAGTGASDTKAARQTNHGLRKA